MRVRVSVCVCEGGEGRVRVCIPSQGCVHIVHM